jgi:ubiquinone/menaquinone biosynthesis C-methylase UbiE
LAPLFTEAIGLDPDIDMLAEAERQAADRGVTNVRWVCALAEDLPAGLGEFRVVMFASSFHWMDRDQVAATVLRMLEPGGALVHMSDLKDVPAVPASLPAPPYPRIGELVRLHLGPVRRAGRGGASAVRRRTGRTSSSRGPGSRPTSAMWCRPDR